MIELIARDLVLSGLVKQFTSFADTKDGVIVVILVAM